MISASAPGKIILCGEHAVVYGQPALALPMHGVAATATLTPTRSGGLRFAAPDLRERWSLRSVPSHPLSRLALHTIQRLGLDPSINAVIGLRSTIPIASGMGSGAALGAAVVRVISLHAGQPLAPAAVSELVYESERYYHGTPSGIDNTVVSFGQALWFQRTADGPRLEPLQIGAPLTLLVADSGVRCSTKITVGLVREQWQANPAALAATCDEIGQVAAAVRARLAAGDLAATGPLLSRNHELLQRLNVSSLELDRLVWAAQESGAWGAKLSGGGGGGVMLALVHPEAAAAVRAALLAVGAAAVLSTTIPATV